MRKYLKAEETGCRIRGRCHFVWKDVVRYCFKIKSDLRRDPRMFISTREDWIMIDGGSGSIMSAFSAFE